MKVIHLRLRLPCQTKKEKARRKSRKRRPTKTWIKSKVRMTSLPTRKRRKNTIDEAVKLAEQLPSRRAPEGAVIPVLCHLWTWMPQNLQTQSTRKSLRKKAKSLDSSGIEGIMELNDSSTKKKGKYSKYGQDDDSASVGSNRSSGSHKSLGKKKKAKGSKTRNSLEISPRKKKNKSLGSASRSFDSSEANSSRVGKKKKNKKTSRGSHGAFSDDSLYSDDTSVDWTDQEIIPSPSSETDAGETAMTADSILQ
mmetsp:Transcript_4605/g.9591  ORF Transcript_4605/g.9591 Transcript_4605/m.9591 type:complete len:252 (+) Transcript_4605:419-1174(+)